MHRLLFLSSVAAALMLAAPATAQLPPACYCSLKVDNSSVTDNDVGSASTNAYCEIIYPDGQPPACRVVGTITFTYQPSGAFSWTLGQWGDPQTSFSEPSPSSTTYFTHPTNAALSCGQGTVGSWLFVQGSVSGNPHWMNMNREWDCLEG